MHVCNSLENCANLLCDLQHLLLAIIKELLALGMDLISLQEENGKRGLQWVQTLSLPFYLPSLLTPQLLPSSPLFWAVSWLHQRRWRWPWTAPLSWGHCHSSCCGECHCRSGTTESAPGQDCQSVRRCALCEGRRGERVNWGGLCTKSGVTHSTVVWHKCCTSVLCFLISVSCVWICTCTAAGREVSARLAMSTLNLHTRYTYTIWGLGRWRTLKQRIKSTYTNSVKQLCYIFYSCLPFLSHPSLCQHLQSALVEVNVGVLCSEAFPLSWAEVAERKKVTRSIKLQCNPICVIFAPLQTVAGGSCDSRWGGLENP